uniref:Uncharacterized protein n=2 Tax=Timspurckia oligopyrenoides TaxID=708627 RepID=A0A7S0ZFA9_9RHOD|mmetsp:Transcript_3095/g.5451  ORF Transcript_3095/g.5451 Transcript_3095/m.5451 type:complete len:136 (+) Transcript_3095:53-460(+)
MASGGEGTEEKFSETVEMLALHETEAIFKEIVDRPCMHMTSMCPDKCKHGGSWAVFDIVEYKNYSKPGQYGSEKQKQHHLKLNEQPEDVLLTIQSLKENDKVILNWRHDYVSRTHEPSGGVSKFPRHPVTKLEKI